MSLSAALDRLVRVEVALAGRRQPVFRVCALAGFAVAVVVGAALTAAAGRSLAVTGILAVVCGATFAVHTLARTVVTGRNASSITTTRSHAWRRPRSPSGCSADPCSPTST